MEVVGDKVPHPAVTFLTLIGVTTKVHSPSGAFGIRLLFISMATHFTNFCVVGVIPGAPAAQQVTEHAY